MKVILFANTDWYLYNFRRELAVALREDGHEVVLVSPPGKYVEPLQAMGFRWLPSELSRRGMNPFAELAVIIALWRLYRRERPDLVHHFTIKPVLYGSIAAHFAGVRPIVNSITGLGYVFLPGGLLKGLLRGLVQGLYRAAVRRTQIIFENDDDLQTFLRAKIIRAADGHLIPGVGVDTERFNALPEPTGPPVVLLASRMLWDKGVGEYVEAAGLIRGRGLEARFALAGRTDSGNPASIPEAQLEAWRRDGTVEWWGWQEDMPLVLAGASIVCLPSYYREGVPTILIEAAACARPLVATDAPGCRDIARNDINGLLVPVRDVPALAAALTRLLESADLRRSMGTAGRQIVENEFSSRIILGEILKVYAKASAEGA